MKDYEPGARLLDVGVVISIDAALALGVLTFDQVGDEAVVVLSHNKPVGYILSPRLMTAFLDAMADRAIALKATPRLKALSKSRWIFPDQV